VGDAGKIQEARLAAAAPLAAPGNALVVFILNVGDGDAIVIRFPKRRGSHEYAVVDSNNGPKTRRLLQGELHAHGLRFVCATHPHLDHIRGLRAIIETFSTDSREVGEFWDSGFRYTSATYNKIIKEVEKRGVEFVRPTSGFETFVNGVRITVLSPSIMLRNRYDTYGVDPNNASIVLRLEYPLLPPSSDYPEDGNGVPDDDEPRTRSIILGGDAQTDAWSRVLEEFPHLDKDERNWARQIRAGHGRQPLFCDVHKVAHHCSKHGLNLELIERMGDRSGAGHSRGPRHLVSSCADDSTYGFPHTVAQVIMREVRDPRASSGTPHKPDDKLGIHYTAQTIAATNPPAPAGSIAVVLRESGSTPVLYRLCDGDDQDVDLSKARKVV
jgi:beta-lactamase superfamily II metal-dependent hydrolase